jgi:RNA polymerase sigma factor (sigma-70 family)
VEASENRTSVYEAHVPPPAVEFDTLLSRARQGDHGAMAEISRQYEPQLRLVAHRLLGPALRPYLDSVDLVQSVHKSLLLGLRQQKFDISTPESLLALALEMVRHKAARQARRFKRQRRLEGETPSDSDPPGPLASLPSREADPAGQADVRDSFDFICRFLDRHEQHILDRRRQGYKQVEIADELGVDRDVFRVYWSRTVQRLRARGVLEEWL